MRIVHTVREARDILKDARTEGKRIGFVPTMGALHQGHLSLVELARRRADYLVMSIFVNALQFNSNQDLTNYPRELANDAAKAESVGVDLIFAPSDEEIYPGEEMRGPQASGRTLLRAGRRSQGLCGASRPGHFDGVVTVVSILFNIVEPDVAVFGDKDYQQLKVIEQLVADLHFPVEIVAGPLMRDDDGLAMSSRNKLLSAAKRQQALALPRALFRAQQEVRDGERSVEALRQRTMERIAVSGLLEIDYVEIVDINTLDPLTAIGQSAQLVAAVFCGSVRLIDNVRLGV